MRIQPPRNHNFSNSSWNDKALFLICHFYFQFSFLLEVPFEKFRSMITVYNRRGFCVLCVCFFFCFDLFCTGCLLNGLELRKNTNNWIPISIQIHAMNNNACCWKKFLNCFNWIEYHFSMLRLLLLVLLFISISTLSIKNFSRNCVKQWNRR